MAWCAWGKEGCAPGQPQPRVWTLGFRFGEALKPGPYTVGGSSGSGIERGGLWSGGRTEGSQSGAGDVGVDWIGAQEDAFEGGAIE